MCSYVLLRILGISPDDHTAQRARSWVCLDSVSSSTLTFRVQQENYVMHMQHQEKHVSEGLDDALLQTRVHVGSRVKTASESLDRLLVTSNG
jgi:hypothetical protein